MQAIAARRSIREYASRSLPLPVLSDLLWAAFGINRPDTGDRTAPSWRHAIEAEVYVADSSGVWRYEPVGHTLQRVGTTDIRAETGTQPFVVDAAVNLIFVADGERMLGASAADARLYAFTDAGFIGQNVYLYCASEGLATVFRGSVDRVKVGELLGLPPNKFVTFAQSVGYPAQAA
jgi:nitroreductase